ncbi:MAG: AmmeMemoRadiSam system radical SAM enzyme [Candidatus Omnitrophota bacterium]|nr:AmmeMemoRadiSam system radical SAM enzyme [Candidatus Omnitrophota bacterium]
MKSLFGFIIIFALFLGLLSLCFLIPRLSAELPSKEALFYQKLENKNVQCGLCPRRCFIASGKRGYCGVRENRNGTLYALTFAKAVSAHPNDPIEKKPFFHFLPGSFTFSVATAGCNLKCKFCQNWEISQRTPEEVQFSYLEPRELIQAVRKSGRNIIAYTYSEPTIFFEYMLETAKLAKAQGLINVMHSNGFINEEPLRELCKYLDGADIDLKGFSEEYYQKLCEGSLEPVLKSLKILKENGVHLEITNLILPGFNDNLEVIRQMCVWIKDNLGVDTPLHLSRFHPQYQLIHLNPTPLETLEKAGEIARDVGLRYVYIGNLPTAQGENTYCPKCKKMVIGRKGFFVLENNLINGRCKFCDEKIEGIWQ